jgi:hypothetical protein
MTDQVSKSSADVAGFDQGQRDRVGRRRRLLPRLQRHRVHRQRGERPPLDPPPRPDHPAQHHGPATPPRDPERAREHLPAHEGPPRRGHRLLGHQRGARRDVSVPAPAFPHCSFFLQQRREAAHTAAEGHGGRGRGRARGPRQGHRRRGRAEGIQGAAGGVGGDRRLSCGIAATLLAGRIDVHGCESFFLHASMRKLYHRTIHSLFLQASMTLFQLTRPLG